MATWSLTAELRSNTVERVAANISSLSYFKKTVISDEIARQAAAAIEKKAYTAAEVAARTTTGNRPIAETTASYARKLGELLLEVVQNGGYTQGAAVSGKEEELDLTGTREFLTKDSATEVLQPMLVKNSKIKKIKFSTKSFGRDAAHVAAKAIENVCETLVDADISDIIAGRPEDEVLDVLAIITKATCHCKLKLLNISDNALGEKGIRACSSALTSQSGLESLSLQNIGCSVHACAAVAELLAHCTTLRQLHLFNNMSDNEGAAHIAKVLSWSKDMTDFKMVSSRVGPEGGAALAEALMAGTNLVKLDISDNPMTAEVAPALAKLVVAQPNLRYLNLNDTCLEAEGVTVICKALQQTRNDPQLETLELALNEIDSEAAVEVARTLSRCTCLQRLNLRENELCDRGATVLSLAIKKLAAAGAPLKVIDLTQNQIKRAGAVALAEAATQLKSLEQLILDENEISADGVEQVKSILKKAGREGVLSLVDNDEDASDGEDADVELEDEADLAATFGRAAI